MFCMEERDRVVSEGLQSNSQGFDDQSQSKGAHFKVGWDLGSSSLHPGMWDDEKWSISGTGQPSMEAIGIKSIWFAGSKYTHLFLEREFNQLVPQGHYAVLNNEHSNANARNEVKSNLVAVELYRSFTAQP